MRSQAAMMAASVAVSVGTSDDGRNWTVSHIHLARVAEM